MIWCGQLIEHDIFMIFLKSAVHILHTSGARNVSVNGLHTLSAHPVFNNAKIKLTVWQELSQVLFYWCYPYFLCFRNVLNITLNMLSSIKKINVKVAKKSNTQKQKPMLLFLVPTHIKEEVGVKVNMWHWSKESMVTNINSILSKRHKCAPKIRKKLGWKTFQYTKTKLQILTWRWR